MKKTFLKAIKTFFATAALLGLAACNNLSVDSDDVTSPVVPGQKSAVTFNLSAPGRTVFPNITLSDYAYKVAVDDGAEVAVTVTGGTTSAIEVQPGAHTFTVNGYKNISETQTKVLTGSTTATISALSTELNIVLKGADGSTGTISATLSLGAALGVTTYKVGVGASLPMAVPDGDATAVSNNEVAYTGSAASGTTQYVVFFLYDSESHLVCPYTFPMYVVAGLTTTAIETLTTATFTATVTVTKDSAAWNDSGLEVKLVNAANANDAITMTTTAGTNTYTANAVEGKTYKVYVGGVDKGVTVSKDSTTATLDYTGTAVFPNMGAADAYADTYFEISFDSAPTVNRASTGTVRIYESDGTLVDTIKPAAETMYGYGYGGNSGLGSINVQYQLIQAIGTKVRIIPHHNTTTGLTLLENGKTYYVVVDAGLISVNSVDYKGIGAKEWTFTTGAAPSVSGSTLTVGTDKNFITVQGAFSWLMKNNKTGDWEIKIDKGVYYERIFYSGKANITMSGQTTTTYGTDVEIQWCNQDGGDPTKVTNTLWNYGSRGRNVFYFAGANLVLENLSIINTATRKSNEYGEHDSTVSGDNANGNNQAEALLFDSKGNCAAYNCNFTSKQDTVYLSPSGGKAWFYGCKISGDVDFIWGLSNVALFEKCNIISAYDSDKSSNHDTYVVAPHLPNTSAPYGKGFVLYNSTITTESGQNTYLARSPWGNSGSVSQVAIIDTTVTGGLKSAWYGSHVGGADETILGWKWYGVDVDGTAITADHQLSQAQYEAEFAGRRNIINRVYNGTEFEKDTVSNWDINALATARNWNVVEDTSKETLDGETEVTSVVWETSKASLAQTKNKTFYMYTDLTTTETAPTGDDLYNYLYCDGSANDYIQGSLELYGTAAIYVPVKTNSTATIAFTQGAGTLTVAGTDYTASASVTVDCSSATLATLNGNKYVEVRVKGTAGGTGDKWYVTNIAVTTVKGSSSSDIDTSVIASEGSTITNSDTSSLSGVTIALTDSPIGYASEGTPSWPTDATEVTVSTKTDLVNYAKSETPYIIYVDGMIDMSEDMLPSVGGGTTPALDAFVNTTSEGAYTTYPAWMVAYAKACDLTTNDKSSSDSAQEGESTLRKMMWKLNSAYGGKITLTVKSNKIIIGKTATSGIKGGTIQINGQSNIQIRNLTIQDAYDPFPHHEVNSKGITDGYNAQWDGINVQGTCSHIWIDHCTFEDTLSLAHVYTTGDSETVDEKGNKKYDEKWQTYDGLCDIKGNTQYVTVSYCKFRNHDKTMLIGNDDDETAALGGTSPKGVDSGKTYTPRKITLHHNYFYNCVQRLPMVRNTNIHIFNNYYHASSTDNNDYAIGIRYQANVYSEKNYFSSGIKYSYSGNSSNKGTLWVVEDADESSKKGKGSDAYNIATEAPFTPPYTWTAEETTGLPTTVPTKAGAGATVGEQGGSSNAIAETTTITFGEAGNYGSITKLDTQNATINDNGGDNSKISGTLSFDVKAGAEIAVSSYLNYTDYTLSDGTTTSETQTGTSYSYTATSDCTITIVCGSNNYFYSIAIVYPISSDTFFDLRTLFNDLSTGGNASSGRKEGLTYSSMYYKDNQHGAYFYNGSTVSFNVSGACTIYLGKD